MFLRGNNPIVVLCASCMSYEFHAWLVYIPHASCAWKISLGCDRILCLLDVPGDRKSVSLTRIFSRCACHWVRKSCESGFDPISALTFAVSDAASSFRRFFSRTPVEMTRFGDGLFLAGLFRSGDRAACLAPSRHPPFRLAQSGPRSKKKPITSMGRWA